MKRELVTLALAASALCACGDAGVDDFDGSGEPAWELVACDELEESLGYAPTGPDGPSIPISVRKLWVSNILIPPDAKVTEAWCYPYLVLDGVPLDAGEENGCVAEDVTPNVQGPLLRVVCGEEIIIFDNFHDYQSVPAPDDPVTYQTHGWKEIYILIENVAVEDRP